MDLSLIYSAHNGRGVGLPYCRPFMAKLHYIEFWVSSYNRGGWPVKQFFSENVRDGVQNLLWVINLIYSAHNGRGVGLPYYRPFMAKLHYIEFWVTSYNRGGWPLKQFFLKNFGMESKTFYWYLISLIVPTMVGEWVYHITVLLWQYRITLNFG